MLVGVSSGFASNDLWNGMLAAPHGERVADPLASVSLCLRVSFLASIEGCEDGLDSTN